MQKLIWDLPASLSEHVLGKICLCLNMPVMLKYNEVTELCATNGAEGNVVGWHSEKNAMEQDVLSTIFVHLSSNPCNIQIRGLPVNMIPIVASGNTINCLLFDDRQARIHREQVRILPNFAMTNYASQGRTWPWNPVDLRYCKNHQSIYTCLSRSSCLEGTLILMPFDESKLTGGASGSLRCEFRELEILDDITRMRIAGTLEGHCQGKTRGELIADYQKWKGLRYVPAHVHSALRWGHESEFDLLPPPIPEKWRMVQRKLEGQTVKSLKAESNVEMRGEK